MIPAAFMALVNQRLQVQDHVRIRRSQRHADGRQSLAQADRIDFMLGGSRRPPDTDPVTGDGVLQDVPNALLEDPCTLPYQVNFHEVSPAAHKVVPGNGFLVVMAQRLT